MQEAILRKELLRNFADFCRKSGGRPSIRGDLAVCTFDRDVEVSLYGDSTRHELSVFKNRILQGSLRSDRGVHSVHLIMVDARDAITNLDYGSVEFDIHKVRKIIYDLQNRKVGIVLEGE